MPVRWYDVEGYRVSFDERTDASRFIVVRPGHRPTLVSKGLIDGFGGPTGTYCLCDSNEELLPTHTMEGAIVRLWEAMRAELLGRRDG